MAPSMLREYDLYINAQKPTLGLYVHAGAGLPDVDDPEKWVFDNTMPESELPTDVVQGIEAHGHAFRELG
jgi:hypothetical protein